MAASMTIWRPRLAPYLAMLMALCLGLARAPAAAAAPTKPANLQEYAQQVAQNVRVTWSHADRIWKGADYMQLMLVLTDVKEAWAFTADATSVGERQLPAIRRFPGSSRSDDFGATELFRDDLGPVRTTVPVNIRIPRCLSRVVPLPGSGPGARRLVVTSWGPPCIARHPVPARNRAAGRAPGTVRHLVARLRRTGPASRASWRRGLLVQRLGERVRRGRGAVDDRPDGGNRRVFRCRRRCAGR